MIFTKNLYIHIHLETYEDVNHYYSLFPFLDSILTDKCFAGIFAPFRGQCTRGYIVNFWLPFPQMDSRVANSTTYCTARSFASKTSKQGTETSSEVWI